MLTTTSLKHLGKPERRKSLSANSAIPDVVSNASYSRSERSEDHTIEVVISASAAPSHEEDDTELDDAMTQRERNRSPPPKMPKTKKEQARELREKEQSMELREKEQDRIAHQEKKRREEEETRQQQEREEQETILKEREKRKEEEEKMRHRRSKRRN